MPQYTSRLKLIKPLSGEGANNGRAQFNTNFDTIDTMPGVSIITSSSRPTSPFAGQTAIETNTKRLIARIGNEWVTVGSEETDWTDISYGTGWVRGVGWAGAAVKRLGDLVVFRTTYWTQSGIGNLSVGAAYTIGTIPAAFRPSTTVMLGPFTGRARGGEIQGYSRVLPSGELQITPSVAGIVDGTQSHTSNHIVPPNGVWSN